VKADLCFLAPELLLPAQEAWLALQQRAAEESKHLRSLVETMPGFPPYVDVPTDPVQLLLYYHRVTYNTETGGVRTILGVLTISIKNVCRHARQNETGRRNLERAIGSWEHSIRACPDPRRPFSIRTHDKARDVPPHFAQGAASAAPASHAACSREHAIARRQSHPSAGSIISGSCLCLTGSLSGVERPQRLHENDDAASRCVQQTRYGIQVRLLLTIVAPDWLQWRAAPR
jgi:hypothetical protein